MYKNALFSTLSNGSCFYKFEGPSDCVEFEDTSLDTCLSI